MRVVPYEGPDPPALQAGDPVLCRDLRGAWIPKAAAGPARYDHTDTSGGRRTVRLTVPVTSRDASADAGAGPFPVVNWPAEDVTRDDDAA
jgi:hypothetical protein